MTFRMKNGTRTVVTMQPVRQMKNDICMPSVWQKHLDMCCKHKCNHLNKYPAAMRTVKSWKNYLIKDYHVTVKRGDVILWLPEICKDSPFNNLMDEVYGR